MIKQWVSVMCLALFVLTTFGCSSRGFMVIEDAPLGAPANHTLGMRYAVDSGALSPTERYSWLELCEKVQKPSFIFFTDESYVNCTPQMPLTAQANKTTATGWVAGIVAPVVSSGLQAGAIAFAGYEIGRGIGKTGTRVTNNNNGGNTSSTGGSSTNTNGNTNTNTNGNTNGNSAAGGQGGSGGLGGNGGNGGHGGQGGNGGIGGNGIGCAVNNPHAHC
jgi:hypothetical protein